MESGILPDEYDVSFEKFDNKFRAKISYKTNKNRVMYLGGALYKTSILATKEAKEYLDGYFQGGDIRARARVSDFRKKNSANIIK